MGTKRKRLALSCVDCRRRKVKCDRTYPVCVRCQKGGNADSCTYVSHTGQEPSLPTPSEDTPETQHGPTPQVATTGDPYVLAALREMSPHLELQTRRAPDVSKAQQEVERHAHRASYYTKSAPQETFPRSAAFKPPSAGPCAPLDDVVGAGYNGRKLYTSDFGKVMVRGSSFSTHYFGPSFAISMLLQFEELSKFVKGMLSQATSLQSVKDKMASARAVSKLRKKQGVSCAHQDLLQMIPDRAVVDQLVEQYVDTLESTFRVLHLPTFRRDYEAHWRQPEASRPDFLVHLLLVMACVYCVVPVGQQGFVGRSSAGREVASYWILACESWLGEQSQKHVTLTDFQAHTLVFMARNMNCIKLKREWTTSGQLVRLAMSVGMHREPGMLSRKINIFDQEMRRRLWYTIIELDLIATLSRGMPPTIDSFSWDCVPPRNLGDEDLVHDMEDLPQSKNRSVFTRTAFLHTSAESLPLRIEVLSRINSVRLGLDIDAVMQYDSKLRGIIDDMPKWVSENPTGFPRNMLILTLYEFILILHIPFASQSPNKARFFYSVASKRDIAFKTLQLYSQAPCRERHIFGSIRGDLCRAALALSHDMVMSMKTTDVLPSSDLVLSLMQGAVEVFGDRFSQLGQGFHSFWITLSAWSLLRWKIDDSQPAQRFAQDAADKVETLYQKILNTQMPMPLPNGTEQPAVDGEGGVPLEETVVPNAESLQTFETTFPETDQFNFFDDPFSDMNFDLSMAWNLDDYNQLSQEVG